MIVAIVATIAPLLLARPNQHFLNVMALVPSLRPEEYEGTNGSQSYQ